MHALSSRFSFVMIILLFSLIIIPAQAEEDEEETEKTEKTPETFYVELDPAFIVNLADKSRPLHYLKAEVQLVVKGEDIADKIRFHSAPIRHDLVILLSSKSMADLNLQDARDSLQKEAMEKLNSHLASLDKKLVVDEVLFTTFIIQ